MVVVGVGGLTVVSSATTGSVARSACSSVEIDAKCIDESCPTNAKPVPDGLKIAVITGERSFRNLPENQRVGIA